MKYRIWRSLDRPSSFFGIRGKFAYVFLGIAGAGAMLSFAVGRVVGSFMGMLAFAGACVGDYLLVLSLQGKMTDRSLTRKAASRKTPRCIHVLPRSIRSYLNEP
jgi:hypothetical protein